MNGSGGGSGDGPQRDRPWVNLAGWWHSSLFCAGGPVTGIGAELAQRVQLVFSDGATVEDDTACGQVLFIVERGVDLPAEAQIFDSSGKLLGSHPVFSFAAPPLR